MSIKTEDKENELFKFDVFISHSSADKDELARPLAEALEARGLSVWLDEHQLHVGDSIRRGIDDALRKSRFGVVILSPAYRESEWGQKELDAFFAKEKRETKSILPINHGIEDVGEYWPMLADKISLSSIESIDFLADKVQQSIQSGSNTVKVQPENKKKRVSWPSSNWQWLIGLVVVSIITILPKFIPHQTNLSLAQEIVKNYSQNPEGKDLQTQFIAEYIEILKKSIERKDPGYQMQQDTLNKLEEKKLSEVQQVMDENSREGIKSDKDKSDDLVLQGAIAYLTSSQSALEKYQEAIALNSENVVAWNRLGLIQYSIGNLPEAEKAFREILEISASDQTSKAIAYGNLGLIYSARNKLKEAEEYQLGALRINENLNDKKGISNQYTNLGLIYLARYQTREKKEDLNMAENYFHGSLKINKNLERKIGEAQDYSNLSLIALSREDYDLAEDFQREALAINNAIGMGKGIATNYANLGLINLERGGMVRLEEAERDFQKSLKIERALERKVGIATNLGNIGRVYEARGIPKEACSNWSTSLKLFSEINDVNSEDVKQIKELIEDNC